MANLTPWLSTLRCIVPVASSGQILSQYVLVLASMQTPCSHLLRVTHECIVCSLRSSFLNVGMQLICLKDLESEAPVLNSEFCIRGLEGRLTFFFGHLLAEIFGAISLCSFWKGRLKENHLSAVTGRGVDQTYRSDPSQIQINLALLENHQASESSASRWLGSPSTGWCPSRCHRPPMMSTTLWLWLT